MHHAYQPLASPRFRAGERPETTLRTPHLQLDQHAPAPQISEIHSLMESLPNTTTGPSGISAPSSIGLHLEASLCNGPPEAFILGHEFAHLHGEGSGSLHLTLPEGTVEHAVEHGWAVRHPAALTGEAPPTLVMIYGPRNKDEVREVWALVKHSYDFANGALQL